MLNIDWDNYFTDITQATENMVQTTSLCVIGAVLPWLDTLHVPRLFIELAQLLAYLGAGVGFFRFIGAVYNKVKEGK